MSDLDYGALMDSEEQRLAPDTRKGASYGELMDTESEGTRQRLAASLAQAKATAPDTYAKVVGSAKALNVPTAAVETLPEEAKQKLFLQQADAIIKTSPVLASHFSSPEFAKLAHDDIENLSLVDKIVNGWKRGVLALKQFPGALEIAGTSKAQQPAEAGAPGLRGSDPLGMRFLDEQTKAALTDTSRIGPAAVRMAELEAEKQGIPVDPVVAGAMGAKSFSDFWYYFRQKPLEFIATVGAESFPASAPGMAAAIPASAAAGPVGAAGAIGTGSLISDYASQVMQYLQQEGVDLANPESIKAAVQNKELMQRVGAQAAAHAMGVATFDAVSGGLAGKTLAPTAMKPVAKHAMNLALQAPTQGTLGALGEAVGSTMAGQPINAGDVMAEFFGEFAGTPAEVLSASAGKVWDRMRAADAAAKDGAALAQLTELRKASKLAERDPQTFADFVQASAENGPVQDIYVDGRVLMHTLEQSGLDATVLPEGTREQLADAVVTGGDVKIPLGDYTAHLAATDIGTALLEHLKTSPEAMSQAEAQVFMQDQMDTFRHEAERILTGQQQNVELHAQTDAVRQQIYDQLAQVNRFTPAVNESYATLMGSFYTAMAQRLGLTPQEMLQRYPLQVAVENIVRGMALEQRAQSYTREQVEKAQGSYDSFKELMKQTGGVLPRWLPERSRYSNDEAYQYVTEKGEFAFGSQTQAVQYARGLELGQGGRWAAVQEGRFWRAQRVGDEVLKQGSRGQISFGKDIKQGATITLHNSADLSTFVHESGHFYLEVLFDIASRADAPADVRADAQKLLRWFGVEPDEKGAPDASGKATHRTAFDVWQAMPLDEKRPYHEKFARGFEAYLFEGRAPSLELQSLFSRFRAWLINVYRSLKALNVDLTGEVRGVMDRMLASSEQIRVTEGLRTMAPMFDSAKAAQATEAEWQAYQELGREATDTATNELEKRSLRDLKWLRHARSKVLQELQAEAAAKRTAIEKEVSAEVRQIPVYAAQRFLRYGELGEVAHRTNAEREVLDSLAGAPTKLSLPALKAMYGDGPAAPWRYLATGEKGLVATDGVNPDVVAELFGFTSGDELVRKILDAEPEASVIEGMTDQRMLERYGDLIDERAINEAADQAVHNDARARFVASELRFLARAMNAQQETPTGGSVNVLAKAAKAFAEQIIARKKVKDIKPGQYATAEARAAQAAMTAKSPVEKATEKRNQLVNNYATRAAHEAVAEVDRALRYLRKFDNEGTRKNLDPEYLDQIDQLLERFDVKRATQAEVTKRESLAKWIEQQRELGFEPTIDEGLVAEAQRQHYSTMTLESFRGLVEAVKNIEHLGRLKKTLLTAKDKREFAAVVEDLRTSIEANAKGTVAERRTSDRGPLVSIGRLFRNFMADHRKLASLARQMDGWKDAGPLWERIVRTMNDAGNAEAVAREKATVKLGKLFAPILKGDKLGKKAYVRAIDKTLTREERIGIALNMGNEVNRERVLTGEKWSPQQLNAVLDTLTKPEWDFVQNIWDYLNSFRPEIAEKSKRVTGVEPAWVEAQPVTTKHGVYQGGYYPIKYDPLRSSKAEADTASEVQRQMERGLYVRAQTRRGHLEERVKSTGRPMRYDLGVITSHVDQVIHDLSWHEWLIDANRLLRAGAIDSAIRDYYGPEKLRTMKDTLRDIAVGDIGAQTAGDSVLNYLRHGSTIVGLGWRLSTALLQPIGLTQSAARIGTKWVLRGAKHWMGDAVSFESSAKKIAEKSDFMRLRAKTMQREINEIRNKVAGKDSKLEASYFYMIQKMQTVADIPTWWGAYEKAMHENGTNEAKAIALADQAVIDAQGSGQIKDLALVQRGTPAWKLFTNFYSFFNTTYNLTAEAVGRTNFKSVPQVALLAVDMALLYTIPALLSTLLKAGLKGDWDDEEKFVRRLVSDQLNYMLGTVVVLRELGSAVQAASGLQGSDYQGPAAVRFFVAIAKLAKQAEQGEADAPFWKALNETLGTVFHYPAGQVNATADGFAALVDGETTNPGVLITGAKH